MDCFCLNIVNFSWRGLYSIKHGSSFLNYFSWLLSISYPHRFFGCKTGNSITPWWASWFTFCLCFSCLSLATTLKSWAFSDSLSWVPWYIIFCSLRSCILFSVDKPVRLGMGHLKILNCLNTTLHLPISLRMVRATSRMLETILSCKLCRGI